ncbi:MAG: ribonuclease [Halanaerobiales bacterium]|nr:ribonuclease [Halanaerobiales bacterium]
MYWQENSIEEIKEYLKGIEVTADIIERLAGDSRKGVRELAKKYRRIREQEKNKEERWYKMNKRELQLKEEGYKLVAGVDEAGRGPLAGPVVAAAVILKPEIKIIGLDDSKKLTERERERLFSEIKDKAVAVGVGIIDNKVIDRINILQATFRAMQEAINKLTPRPDYILIDGNRELPGIEIQQETVVDGDSKVNAIAAASIIAKVSRDRILDDYHSTYPEYGFLRNKGYGTSEHIEALKKHGPSPIHRYSFSIVSKYNFLKCKEKLLKVQNENKLYQLGEDISKYGRFSEENLERLREIYRAQYQRIVNNK